MHVREVYLRKSGKRPRDKPPSGVMLTMALAFVGLAGLFRRLDPSLQVLAYGIIAGLTLGLFVYIGNDIRRLRKGSG